jgi:hypothetical protein
MSQENLLAKAADAILFDNASSSARLQKATARW